MKIRIMIKITIVVSIAAALMFSPAASMAGDKHEQMIEKWAEDFAPSSLSKEEKIAELRWFMEASRPFRGKKIKSVAEHIKT
ncbi:hypothetical protein QUF76_19290, partial [Desulfobacterales bacterium HSG16]|nr:hypothetical protein [Desulfobacterales bacterium HSG16]